MTRVKKKRSDANRIEWGERPPRRSEKLADPDSYESRKKKGIDKRKKHKSVYEKHLEQEERNEERSEHKGPRGGRLAEKIRRLNRERHDYEAESDDAD